MTALEKWKNDFKEFISELSIPRDDYKGIMEYIDEVPNEALEQKPCEDVVKKDCGNCAYYDNGANDEACNGCFEDEEHLNFKPKTQYCDDCISRQAVLEILKKNRYRFNISQEGYCKGKVLWSENLIKDDACKEIEQLLSVTPKEKTGWIPVSERLPEESKRYVVATKYNDVMTDFYTGEGFLQGDDIIAWMPLPAPFEPQESEG